MALSGSFVSINRFEKFSIKQFASVAKMTNLEGECKVKSGRDLIELEGKKRIFSNIREL